MKKPKYIKQFVIVGIVAILLIAIGVGVYYYYANKEVPMLSIHSYYDINGNEINPKQQSVVGGVQGVSSIKIEIQAQNTDTVPLDFSIKGASPTEFTDTLSSLTTQNVDMEAYTVNWISA